MPPYDKMSLWRYFIILTNEIQKMKITGKEIYGIYHSIYSRYELHGY